MITARRRAGLAAALGVVALAVLGYAAFELFIHQVAIQGHP